MKQYTVYVTFLLMEMLKEMFVIVSAFLLGYCLGYYSFEVFKYKNKKYEINEFFQVIIKNMACSMDFLLKKLDKIKINDDVFLWNDLTFEQKYLNKLIEKIEEEIENQNVEGKVSYYLQKRTMSICCETPIMTETLARKLLKLTDRLMDEHFFYNNGLRELACCSHYMLNRRSYNYHKNKQFMNTIYCFWSSHVDKCNLYGFEN